MTLTDQRRASLIINVGGVGVRLLPDFENFTQTRLELPYLYYLPFFLHKQSSPQLGLTQTTTAAAVGHTWQPGTPHTLGHVSNKTILKNDFRNFPATFAHLAHVAHLSHVVKFSGRPTLPNSQVSKFSPTGTRTRTHSQTHISPNPLSHTHSSRHTLAKPLYLYQTDQSPSNQSGLKFRAEYNAHNDELHI